MSSEPKMADPLALIRATSTDVVELVRGLEYEIDCIRTAMRDGDTGRAERHLVGARAMARAMRRVRRW